MTVHSKTPYFSFYTDISVIQKSDFIRSRGALSFKIVNFFSDISCFLGLINAIA